jgi:hypothetical protein
MAPSDQLWREEDWKKIARLPPCPNTAKVAARGSRTVVSRKGFCGFAGGPPVDRTCRKSIPSLEVMATRTVLPVG